MIKRILVAVDGSDASIDALNYAADIAELRKSELIILTIVHDARSYLQEDRTSIDIAGYTDQLSNYYRKKQEKLLKCARKLKARQEVSSF